MANIIPFAFRGELFSGTHNFASGGDTEDVELAKSNAIVLPIAATPAKEQRKHSPAASAILQWKKQRRKD